MPHKSGMRGAAAIRAWSRRHAYCLLSSIGELIRHPLGAGMTVCVLAFALSLPLALHVLLDNVRELSLGWERLDTISVFLTPEIDEAGAGEFASRVSTWPEVLAVDPVSPQQGLAELAGRTGLGDDTVFLLSDPPLPWVLEVAPVTGADLSALHRRLENQAGVDTVIIDLQWLERFEGMLAVVQRLVQMLFGLFGLAVLFVIGNTVRSEIHNRREEIEVLSLVGATGGFIRRPFLYSGLWYGLLGGVAAWLLVLAGLAALDGPAASLAAAYGSDFALHRPDKGLVWLLIGGSGLLGILGAWISVERQLHRINPA